MIGNAELKFSKLNGKIITNLCTLIVHFKAIFEEENKKGDGWEKRAININNKFCGNTTLWIY